MRGALAVLAALAITGCGPSPGVVTTAQAEVLAQVRPRGYEEGGARFVANAPSGVRIEGIVDWRAHVATGTMGDTALTWTFRGLAASSGGSGWRVRALTPATQATDRLLLMVLNLAGNRPDNPQLLRRNQATWVRTDTLGGVDVDVFRGPAVTTADRTIAPGDQRTLYWVSADGLLRRFEAAAAVVDFSDYGPKKVPLPEPLR